MSGTAGAEAERLRLNAPPCTAIVRQAVEVVKDSERGRNLYLRDWALRVLAETVERSSILVAEG